MIFPLLPLFSIEILCCHTCGPSQTSASTSDTLFTALWLHWSLCCSQNIEALFSLRGSAIVISPGQDTFFFCHAIKCWNIFFPCNLYSKTLSLLYFYPEPLPPCGSLSVQFLFVSFHQTKASWGQRYLCMWVLFFVLFCFLPFYL